MLPYRRRMARTSVRLTTCIALAALSVGPHSAFGAEPTAGGSGIAPARAQHKAQQSTRFVIGLERKTEYQVFSLNNPNRVIVELPDVKMQLPLTPGDAPVGLVRSFRGGQTAPGQSRVVIEMTSPVIVEKAVMERAPDGTSSRLVLDIVAAEVAKPSAAASPPASTPQAKLMRAGAAGLGAIGVQPPMPRPAERPDVRAAKTHKPLIVLDPGHGGHDSGAQKFGTVEKDVVLAFAMVLREKLEKSSRYRVLMTRDNDSFVDLDERRAFGERHMAALFIAIHADYAGTSANGATIYSLREGVAESLKRSARDAVRDRVLAGNELTPIRTDAGEEAGGVIKSFLADLAQRDVDNTKNRTNKLAQSVIEYMGKSTTLRDNPDRSAAFRVLKTAQVPAVLIELAYVSNQQDAQNLRSEEWRLKVTDSIMTAIDNYISHQGARVPM